MNRLLKDVPQGEEFSIFGKIFTVLNHEKIGVLCVDNEVRFTDEPYSRNKDGFKDYAQSHANQMLNIVYLNELIAGGCNISSDIIENFEVNNQFVATLTRDELMQYSRYISSEPGGFYLKPCDGSEEVTYYWAGGFYRTHTFEDIMNVGLRPVVIFNSELTIDTDETNALPLSTLMNYMNEAVIEAHIGVVSKHGGPFGAVIVDKKSGEIIGRGHNRVLLLNDPTCHGEMEAIRDACKTRHNHDLSGCMLFTTGEPCPMCASAIMWANIKPEDVYYSKTIKDAEKLGFRDTAFYDVLKSSEGFGKQISSENCNTLYRRYESEYKNIY